MNMLEKMARARHEAWRKEWTDVLKHDVPVVAWDGLSAAAKAATIRCERAAMEAMREPTEKMMKAGDYATFLADLPTGWEDERGDGKIAVPDTSLEGRYKAIIDEALRE